MTNNGIEGRPSLFEFRSFLDSVRMRATNDLVGYVCSFDPAADPADVHEDVREALWPFFTEIRIRVEGPACDGKVTIGANAHSYCCLPSGHEGNHQPW